VVFLQKGIYMLKNIISTLSPAHIIFFSFFLLTLLGTLLLALPLSRSMPLSTIDLIFTATSATCVTGLFTVPLSSFTLFGKCIIMLLIQLGALGLASMTLLIVSFFMNISLGTRFIAGQLLELNSWNSIKSTLQFTLIFTLVLEAIGACYFFSLFYTQYSAGYALFYALFHSISSFSNAGISFLHFFTEQNLGRYSTDNMFLLVTTALAFCGGLGFITWHEIFLYLRGDRYHKQYHLSLTSKIVLYTTAILIMVTFIAFFLIEYNNTLKHLPLPIALLDSLFHAVSLRSSGFILPNINEFSQATLFFMIVIGFIGSSSGSTGSGIKITTFALICAVIKSTVNGSCNIELFEREIPQDQIYKAITIVVLSICWILIITFCLLITESTWTFFDIFFETVSGFSNVGFSLKGSQNLSYIGKILMSITMFVGRIGTLTFILGLKYKTKRDTAEFFYPQERVMLG